MNEELIGFCRENLRSKNTAYLVEIWRSNNREEWADETFEAIKRLLEERSVPIPPQRKARFYNREKQKAMEILGRAPYDSPQAIREARKAPALLKSILSMFFTDMAAHTAHMVGNYGAELLVIVAGIALTGKIFFADAHLLDRYRWLSFWSGNLLGYFLGQCALILTMALDARDLIPLSAVHNFYVPALLALPVILAIGWGILNFIQSERRNVEIATHWFYQWKRSQPQNY